MSNPFSIYICQESDFREAILNIDWDDDDYEFPLDDHAGDYDSDMYIYVLSELVEQNQINISNAACQEFLNVILWNWLDSGTHIYELDLDAEEHGIDLAISPETVQSLNGRFMDIDSATLAQHLMADNDLYETVDDIKAYLDLWLDTFQQAAANNFGLYTKIWV